MSIKKPYVEIIDFLKANENKKVSSILDHIKELCESKKSTSTVIVNSDNEVVAIYCYYHKQWELLSEVTYGKKANTNSGYNTMCKVGVSKWTKAQKLAKDAKEELLEKVSIGEIAIEDIKFHQDDIENARLSINTEDMPKGYDSEDAVWEAITAQQLDNEVVVE